MMEISKSIRKAVLIAALSACTIGAMAQETPEAEIKPTKNPIAQLRGKLLYRHNQARKLEKAALAADPELQTEIEALDLQKEELFIAANPKLAEVYREQKALSAQIEELQAAQKNGSGK